MTKEIILKLLQSGDDGDLRIGLSFLKGKSFEDISNYFNVIVDPFRYICFRREAKTVAIDYIISADTVAIVNWQELQFRNAVPEDNPLLTYEEI